MEVPSRLYHQESAEINIKNPPLEHAAISDNGYLFTVSDAFEGEITVKNLENKNAACTKFIVGRGVIVYVINVTADGKKLIVTGGDYSVTIWTFCDDRQPCTENARVGSTVGYSASGDGISTSGNSKIMAYRNQHHLGEIVIVDLDTQKITQELYVADNDFRIALSGDGKKIAVHPDQIPGTSEVDLYDTSSGELLLSRVFPKEVCAVKQIGLRGDFALLVGEDKIYIWETEKDVMYIIVNLKLPGIYWARNFALNSDRTMISYSTNGDNVTLQDIRGTVFYVTRKLKTYPVLKFSRDDKRLFAYNRRSIETYGAKIMLYWTKKNHSAFKSFDRKTIGYIFTSHKLQQKDKKRKITAPSPLLQIPNEILLLILSFIRIYSD